MGTAGDKINTGFDRRLQIDVVTVNLTTEVHALGTQGLELPADP